MEDAYGSGLDWDMVRAMQASGHVEIGCHSVSHPVFARLDRTAIEREVGQSRARVIEATGLRPAHFAFPFGQDHEVGPHAPAIVQACGFSAAFTTNPTLMADHSRDAPFTLPRIVLSRKGGRVSAVQAYMSGIPQQIRAKLVS
jgi:peptidoglycan/xylan/chitin deacetylase (PgdA/CDA1 family)